MRYNSDRVQNLATQLSAARLMRLSDPITPLDKLARECERCAEFYDGRFSGSSGHPVPDIYRTLARLARAIRAEIDKGDK